MCFYKMLLWSIAYMSTKKKRKERTLITELFIKIMFSIVLFI